ncbi:MAG TPA: RpiB/LacA/LacB family sugar-phosphate isomerase [Polyangiales bacterium]|nr:RpiB/LacA/LacB family sugar-phosphate isomerase [Polyangiales bacterium]
MRIALCSDEPYPVHATIERWLRERGHEPIHFGSLASGHEEPWALAAEQAASSVASGDCEQGVFLCWTGTGISMAANKLPGIRAALCTDPGQAAAARVWNHANVLCLSNRALSDDMAKELLAAWFDTDPGDRGSAGVKNLAEVDARHRR